MAVSGGRNRYHQPMGVAVMSKTVSFGGKARRGGTT